MKRPNLLQLVFLCLVAAGLLSTHAYAHTDKPVRKITVDAQAKLDVAPNIVYLRMTVKARKATPKEAAREVKSQQAKLVAAFKRANFPKGKLTMSFMRLYRTYKYRGKSRVYLYEASVTLVACIHNLRKLTDYFQLAVENGASELSTQYINDTFVSIRKKLRKMAMKAAKEKAAQMTKAVGAQLGAVLTISETRGNYWSRSRFSNAYARSSRRPTGGVQPGAIPMTLTVRVSFLLK